MRNIVCVRVAPQWMQNETDVSRDTVGKILFILNDSLSEPLGPTCLFLLWVNKKGYMIFEFKFRV